MLWTQSFIPFLQDKLQESNYSVSRIKTVGSVDLWAATDKSDIDLLVRIKEDNLADSQKLYWEKFHTPGTTMQKMKEFF